MTLSQSEAASRSPSGFDGAGCAALTGSDAGKLSIRPASSFAWVSRSADAASRGLAACLSCAAGSNFSAMLSLHANITRRQSGRSQSDERNTCPLSPGRSVRICQMHGTQHNRLDFLPHWSILHRQARRLAVECAGDEIAPSFCGALNMNSDPSPFGIYNLEPPLDLIARPEDCALKVSLPRRPSDRRFPLALVAIIPVV